MPQLSLADRAEMLARRGDLQAAVALLQAEATHGNADAYRILADWALTGEFVRRDLCLSRDLFGRAGALGDAEAASVHRGFLANGTGGARDWNHALALLRAAAPHDVEAAYQLGLIEAMRLDEEGDPIQLTGYEQLSEAPEVLLFPGLLSAAECNLLKDCAEPHLSPSFVVDPETGRQIPNPVRTSESAAFPLVLENPAIHALNRRLAKASATKVEQGEPLQVLRYRPGQEYRAHSDALTATTNQRVLTFLVYLNDDYEGGETAFLETGLKVKGRKGDGLLFRNADDAGRADPQARHAGLPVVKGTKLLASRWIRTRPIDLTKALE